MKDQLITLLVKVGVIAAIASFGVRGAAIKRMLLREERTLGQRLRLSLWFTGLFAPGEIIRILNSPDYSALDLGLEGSLLAGLMGGYVSGMLAGILLSIPAAINHEYLALPFYAAAGLGGGLLRDSASNPDDIWRFSPFPDVNLYRIFEPGRELRSALFHAYLSVTVVAIEFLRQVLGMRILRQTSALHHRNPGAIPLFCCWQPGSPPTSASPFPLKSGTAPAMNSASKSRRACFSPHASKRSPARSIPIFSSIR